jgi:ribonuclease Z
MFQGAYKVPGGALTAADFRKAAEAGGFTGNIIVGTDLAGLRIPRSEVDQLRQALP